MSIEFYLLIHANLFCAEYQIKTIRKFCKDPFKIIILDSNCGEHTDLSVALEKMCAKESVDLIKIPNEFMDWGVVQEMKKNKEHKQFYYVS
jgi:hypothetical protein